MIEPKAMDVDADLERRIEDQVELLGNAPTDAEKISAWEELKRLHAMRSPERVAQMEREAGIR